ncbi:MAG: outer membrane beta-barrel family protein, partial [Paramuribaculum sp.]|nr:outer membrane beta-barrel family protein [Paramuribaculum sp.]
HTDRDTRQSQSRQYLFTDSTSWNNSLRNSRDKGHNIRADFRVQWQPDSFNTLEFRPRISYNTNNSTSLDSSLIIAGDPRRSQVSSTFNNNSSRGNSLEFGANLTYSHNFKRKRGRSFSINMRYNHSNVREKENSFSRNMFYLYPDSIDLYDQYGDNHTWNNTAQARVSWTEPIGNAANGHFLTFSYQIQYRWNNADKMVYDHPVHYPSDTDNWLAWIDYTTLQFNDTLSNRFRNDFMTQNIRLGYKYVSRKHNVDVGVSLVPSQSKSENLINGAKSIPMRRVWNFAPFLRYRLKIDKSTSFNAYYQGRASQPSLSQLQPVADMSNPMSIIVGNPNLAPTFNHWINLRFQSFNSESQRSIMSMANFGITQNSIVSKTTFNHTTGSQITTYENVNGVWNGRLMVIYSQPLRNKAWQLSTHMFANYNHAVGFNNGQRNNSGTVRVNLMPAIAFRPDNMEFELRPRYSLQYTHNSLSTTSGMKVHNYGGSFSAYYYTPIGIILNSDLTYTATSGYTQGYDKNEWMWNASISYQLLRDRSLTLAVKAYDLLQQRSSINRTVTANYIDDTSYNNLTRYFMFTMSYRFNTFGKGNQPTDRNAWHGPGGPGPRFGGGRGPR